MVFSNLYFPTYISSPGGLDEGLDLPEEPLALLPELAPADDGRKWAWCPEGLWWWDELVWREEDVDGWCPWR